MANGFLVHLPSGPLPWIAILLNLLPQRVLLLCPFHIPLNCGLPFFLRPHCFTASALFSGRPPSSAQSGLPTSSSFLLFFFFLRPHCFTASALFSGRPPSSAQSGLPTSSSFLLFFFFLRPHCFTASALFSGRPPSSAQSGLPTSSSFLLFFLLTCTASQSLPSGHSSSCPPSLLL